MLNDKKELSSTLGTAKSLSNTLAGHSNQTKKDNKNLSDHRAL